MCHFVLSGVERCQDCVCDCMLLGVCVCVCVWVCVWVCQHTDKLFYFYIRKYSTITIKGVTSFCLLFLKLVADKYSKVFTPT